MEQAFIDRPTCDNKNQTYADSLVHCVPSAELQVIIMVPSCSPCSCRSDKQDLEKLWSNSCRNIKYMLLFVFTLSESTKCLVSDPKISNRVRRRTLYSARY